MTLSAIGSTTVTTNRRISIPPKAAKEMQIEQGTTINFFKDEYGRIFIVKATVESILSKLELPAAKPVTQKTFP